MIFIQAALHLILFGCETAAYSFFSEKCLGMDLLLAIEYISNQVTYYEKLPELNYYIVGMLIFGPIAAVMLYVAMSVKKYNKYIYLLIFIYLLFYALYILILKPNIETLIRDTYGTSATYFNDSLLWYVCGLSVFWIIIVILHSWLDKLIRRFWVQ